MSSCLLFDCDGTLVDSERLCNIGLVRKFAEKNINLDAEELVVRFRGWKLSLILETLTQEHSISIDEAFVSSYRAIVGELFETELKPVEGIEVALRALPHKKAVVSSGPLAKIQQALRVTGLSDYFESNLYSSYEIGIWKPDPGIYRHAAKDMGYAAKDCAVIDDGLVGVEAGSLAGMKTYFYNRYNEKCGIPGVVSFGDMNELPYLIGT